MDPHVAPMWDNVSSPATSQSRARSTSSSASEALRSTSKLWHGRPWLSIAVHNRVHREDRDRGQAHPTNPRSPRPRASSGPPGPTSPPSLSHHINTPYILIIHPSIHPSIHPYILQGSAYQRIHRDAAPLFPENLVGQWGGNRNANPNANPN